MQVRIDLTQDKLKERLIYIPETGEWFWKNGPRKGKRAGSIKQHGYRAIDLDSKRYYSARLAFLYMTGSFPKYTTDHIDRNRSNDKWSNLRDATRTEQMFNQNKRKCRNPRNKNLPKGVMRNGSGYMVMLTIENKKRRYFGTFRTLEEASIVAEEICLDRFA